MSDINVEKELKSYQKLSPAKKRATKNLIIQFFTPLVRIIAKKISMRLPANIEVDDLISAGIIGLMDAIEKYDPTRNNKFKTYAEFRIRGTILDELRAQDWVPRSMRERAKNVERAFLKIEQKLGRSASEVEVALNMGMDLNKIQETIKQAKNVALLSLDDTGYFKNGDKKSILSMLHSNELSNPISQISKNELREQIASYIEELPEKQRMVLALYYYEDLNLKEIGRILEVTESRVSQLHTQAMMKLRSRMFDKYDELNID